MTKRTIENRLQRIAVSDKTLEEMLREAFELGRKSVEEEAQEKADFKHQIFMKACNDYYKSHPEERR